MHRKQLFLSLCALTLALASGCGTTSGHYVPPTPFPDPPTPPATGAKIFKKL